MRRLNISHLPEYRLPTQVALHAWLDGLGLLQRPVETFALLSRLNCAVANHFADQSREEEGVQVSDLGL